MRKNKSIATGGLWQDFLREPAPMRIEGLQLFCDALVFPKANFVACTPIRNGIYKNRFPSGNQIPI